MIPTVDPQVKHVTSSYLRKLNVEKLSLLEGLLVVSDAALNPLAVIVPYELYLKIQQAALKKEDDGVPE